MKKDIQVTQWEDILRVSSISLKASEEFYKLPPKQLIERWHDCFLLKRVARRSFSTCRSNANWKKRRKAYFKTIGLNYVSKYTPLMLRQLEARMSTWEEGTEIKF